MNLGLDRVVYICELSGAIAKETGVGELGACEQAGPGWKNPENLCRGKCLVIPVSVGLFLGGTVHR